MVIAAAIFGSVLCFIFEYNGVRHLGVLTTSMFQIFTPIVTLITSWLLLGERVNKVQIIGGITVILGMIIVNFQKGGDIRETSMGDGAQNS